MHVSQYECMCICKYALNIYECVYTTPSAPPTTRGRQCRMSKKDKHKGQEGVENKNTQSTQARGTQDLYLKPVEQTLYSATEPIKKTIHPCLGAHACYTTYMPHIYIYVCMYYSTCIYSTCMYLDMCVKHISICHQSTHIDMFLIIWGGFDE